jgi:hypothetical protein
MNVANDALTSVHEIPENKPLISVSHLEFRPGAPVPTKQEKPGARLTLPSLMYAFVLFTFLILGVLLLRTINHHIQVKAAAASAAQSGVVSGTDAPTPVATRPAGTIPAPAAVSTATPSPAPASAGLPAALTATAQAEPPKPAPYKLQAVFYNPARPAAMIGGKTVFIGDHVGLYRVKSITSDTVTLESGGQVKVLKLQ